MPPRPVRRPDSARLSRDVQALVTGDFIWQPTNRAVGSSMVGGGGTPSRPAPVRRTQSMARPPAQDPPEAQDPVDEDVPFPGKRPNRDPGVASTPTRRNHALC